MGLSFHSIERPPAAVAGWAPFALGFRPFFLAAGLYAVAMMVAWVLVLQGRLDPGALSPLVWHGHEMLFGFTVAVIAGFLLTAAQNWTGIATPAGRPLAALFVLWLAGRVAFVVPGLPAAWVAVLDLAFLPLLAVALARPIVRAKQLHNAPFPLMLGALAAANALVHAEALGWSAATAETGLHLAVYVVVAMIAVIGGRVIPSFTDNRLRTRARRWPVLERAVPVVTVAALVAALAAPTSPLTAALAAVAAIVHGVRLAGWYTPKYWAVPLLWVLHLGYAWVVLGFALLALAAAGVDAAAGSALHAFTAGAIGVLTLGMMARVSLGHTGRLLEASPLMAWAFAAVNLGALVRVGVPLVLPDAYATGMAIAGGLWALAFALFAAYYAPVLLRPRVDGKPG
jgi:uncharacterized protein involved in response to NO